MTNTNRPILISVAQYMDELESGAMTVFDVIDAAHRLGADGVELRREVWTNCEDEIKAARSRVEELGLIVTFATHSTLFNADHAGHERMRKDIDLASALGSPLFRVFQGPAPDDDDEAGWEIGQGAINHAAFLGLTIALENYVGMPGGKLAEIKRVLDRFPSPALGTNIDMGNYTKHEQDVVAAIEAIGDRAIYSHLKDIETPEAGGGLTHLGGGTLPMDDIISALDSLPQQLMYCFEFRGGGDPDGRIEKSIAYLKASASRHK